MKLKSIRFLKKGMETKINLNKIEIMKLKIAFSKIKDIEF